MSVPLTVQPYQIPQIAHLFASATILEGFREIAKNIAETILRE
jgi:hypothetical protein